MLSQPAPENHKQRASLNMNTAERNEIPSDVTTNPACAQDVAAFCQKEVNIVALLREAPDMVEPRKIFEAVRKIRLCMTVHADVLSVDCLSSLSSFNAMSPTIASAHSKRDEVFADDGEDYDEGMDGDSSMEINIYYSKHHNGAGHALRSSGALAANHVKTIGSSSDLAGVLSHPITWVFVLPFFFIGLYVSVTRMTIFLRRRREERRIESKLYMPVT